MSDDSVLDAALTVLNEEFNAGENFSELPVEPAEAPETDTPELKIDATGRAHGPDGKFTPKEEGEEEEPTEETSEQEASTEEVPAEEEPEEDDVYEIDDPDISAFLDKYQGDPIKALKAAVEAQSLIGRQGAELSELRKIQDQLEVLQRQAAAGSVDWADAIENDPKAAADMAVQYGNGQALIAALRSWADEDPIAPVLYLNALQQENNSYQQQQTEATTLESEFAALKERHPDVDKFLPAIEKIASERPLWREAINQGDPKDRAKAFEDLYHLARSQSDASDTSAAARRIVLRQKAEAEKAREDASVVTASNTPVTEATGPTGDALLQEALRDISGLDDLIIV